MAPLKQTPALWTTKELRWPGAITQEWISQDRTLAQNSHGSLRRLRTAIGPVDIQNHLDQRSANASLNPYADIPWCHEQAGILTLRVENRVFKRRITIYRPHRR